MATLRERLTPRALPTRDYIGSNLFVTAVLQLIFNAIVAGLAVSRANGNRLTGWTVAVILIGSAASGAVTGSIVAFIGGIYDSTQGLVLPDERDPAASKARDSDESDPLTPRNLWVRAAMWGVGAGVWATAVGLLIVAALNGRSAGFPVVYIGLIAVSGVTAVTANAVWRATGVGVARSAAPSRTVSLRRRAWIEIGLPMGILLGIATGFFTWVLFHDYAVGDAFAEQVLTESELFADLLVVIVIAGGFATFLGNQSARADVRLGHVTPDDPDTQIPPAKTRFGPQALVYTGFATFFFAAFVRLLVPALPTLTHAVIVRGVLGGLLAWVMTSLAYVRGAGNELVST